MNKNEIVGLLDMRNVAEAVKYISNFRSTAGKFRLIDEEGQTAVIARYGDGNKLVKELEVSQPGGISTARTAYFEAKISERAICIEHQWYLYPKILDQ